MDIERRTVLQVSGALAVGGLVAACSTGGGSPSGGAAQPTQGGAGSAAASAGAPGAVASTADIPVGGGVIVTDPAVVVTQPTAGEFKAFSAICTHQGCLVGEVADNEIICPCHGSRFSATDGSVLQGPATDPLASAAITVQGGSVVLS
jgi:nitrite reductase/ring-hydroxylating ferredoxin subunit